VLVVGMHLVRHGKWKGIVVRLDPLAPLHGIVGQRQATTRHPINVTRSEVSTVVVPFEVVDRAELMR
jgi:hypothetical protein